VEPLRTGISGAGSDAFEVSGIKLRKESDLSKRLVSKLMYYTCLLMFLQINV
jgi:hypothetical protein